MIQAGCYPILPEKHAKKTCCKRVGVLSCLNSM
jgi:hypothetical protein